MYEWILKIEKGTGRTYGFSKWIRQMHGVVGLSK